MIGDVVVWRCADPAYPSAAPFHPDRRYPEYRGPLGPSNPVYDGVRSCLALAGLDIDRYGTPDWNPFKGLIKPGETVLLKPNMVKESHPRDPDGWRYVITHGSVIRAVADYVCKAIEGRGRIVIADAPQTDSSFTRISQLLELESIEQHYRDSGLTIAVIDLRKEEWVSRDGVVVERRRLPGDPQGYLAFDLAGASEFTGHSGEGRYYGADYDIHQVNGHHTGGRHEYLVSATAINADVVISLPKLKTHKKAGVTISLKNLVGINGDKNWLPHHTESGLRLDGDERPERGARTRIERSAVRQMQNLSRRYPRAGTTLHQIARRGGRTIFGDTEEVVRNGNWWGNDTIWRMCLDLNKVLLYGGPDGRLRPDEPSWRKRHYVIVDGIIAGDGRGPMNPDPVPAGLLVFGTAPAKVDATCAVLMGFEPELIPIVRQAFLCRQYPICEDYWPDIRVISNEKAWSGRLASIEAESTFHFAPHFGWKGRIERTREHNVTLRSSVS